MFHLSPLKSSPLAATFMAVGIVSGCSYGTVTIEDEVGQLSDPSGQPVSLATNSGKLVRAEAVDNPDPANTPAGVTFDSGFYDFEIDEVAPGATVHVTLELPPGSTPSSYYKYQDGAFVLFNFNGTEGAQFNGSTVTLTIIDGGLGDDDGVANGVIVDPGAPGFQFVADTSPDAFTFNDLIDQNTSALVTSNTVDIAGINQETDISIIGGEYSIGCTAGGFTAAAGTVNPDDTVCVAHTTSSDNSATVTSTLTVGDLRVGFSSTTASPAETFAVSGTISGVPAGANSGQWIFRLGDTFANDGPLSNGAVAYNAQGMEDGSSFSVTAQPQSGVSCTVSNGSGTVSGADVSNVDIVCTAADTSPDAFVFMDQTDVAKSTVITSAPITVSGIDAPTSISVFGGEYSIGCTDTFTSIAATIENNETVCVQHTSANAQLTATNTSLFIGDATDVFTSTTAADETVQFNISGNISVDPVSANAGTWELRVNAGFVNDGPLTNGDVTFGAATNDGDTYEVRVTASEGFSCTSTNASGTISGADVTNVAIGCAEDEVDPPPTAAENVEIKGWKFSNPLPQGEHVNLVIESDNAVIAMDAKLQATGSDRLNVMQRSEAGEWFHIGRREVGLEFRSAIGYGDKFFAFLDMDSLDGAFQRGVYSSSDAVTWNLVTTNGVDFSDRFGPDLRNRLVATNSEILGAGSHFVDGERNSFLYRSGNGQAWTATQIANGGTDLGVGQIATNGSQAIVAGLHAYSTDNGATWQASSVLQDGSPVDPVDANIVWDGMKFVGLFGRDSYTSADGEVWEKHANVDNDPITTKGFNIDSLSTDGNGNILVALRLSTTLRKSTDGISFSVINPRPGPTIGLGQTLGGAFISSGEFLAVGVNGQVYSSSDAAQTLTLETPGLRGSDTSNDVAVYSFATDGSVAVAGGMSSGTILRATDLSGWEEQTRPTFKDRFNRTFTVTDRYVGAHWTGDKFVLMGAGGTIVTSADGTSWTLLGDAENSSSRSPSPADFAQTGQTVVILNPNTRSLSRSTDNGATFTTTRLSNLGVDSGHRGLIHDGSNFILVGEEVATSVDGETWTVAPLAFGERASDFEIDQLESIAFLNGVYTASYSGLAVYSSDAINWTLGTGGDANLVYSGSGTCVNEVVNGTFYMACDSGPLFRSDNGSEWDVEMGRAQLINLTSGEVTADNTNDVAVFGMHGVHSYLGRLIVHGVGGVIMDKALSIK